MSNAHLKESPFYTLIVEDPSLLCKKKLHSHRVSMQIRIIFFLLAVDCDPFVECVFFPLRKISLKNEKKKKNLDWWEFFFLRSSIDKFLVHRIIFND